jgi:hypothetical protein
MQCDYNTYITVVLNSKFINLIIYIQSHGHLQISKSCKNCLVTSFNGQCNVLLPLDNFENNPMNVLFFQKEKLITNVFQHIELM